VLDQNAGIAIKTDSLVSAFKLSCINYSTQLDSTVFAWPTATIYAQLWQFILVISVWAGQHPENTVANSFAGVPTPPILGPSPAANTQNTSNQPDP